MTKLTACKRILRNITVITGNILDGNITFTTLPMGSPISPLLANIFMDHFEEKLFKSNESKTFVSGTGTLTMYSLVSLIQKDN